MTNAMLIEYGISGPPLIFSFDINPEGIERTRSATVNTPDMPGTRGGWDFQTPLDSNRASQGISMQAETFTLKIILDATDRLSDGEPLAALSGVQPEIDTLRSMVEPKIPGSDGTRMIAALSKLSGQEAVFAREFASVIIFRWGVRMLPVFLTKVAITEKHHLPNLFPYVAEARIDMQVIESNNPIFNFELNRQNRSTAMNATRTVAVSLSDLFS